MDEQMKREKEQLDQALPHADDVTHIIGLAEIGGTKIGIVQLIMPEEFRGFPKTLFVKEATVFSGGDPVEMVVFYESPETIMLPLLAVTPHESTEIFLDRADSMGMYLFDVIDPEYHHRALVNYRTHDVQELFKHAISKKMYEHMKAGAHTQQMPERPSA